jgi:hypothetical protein
LLATATFTSETASGWQEVNFPTPVTITPGVTYIAADHTSSGFYSDTPGQDCVTKAIAAKEKRPGRSG